MWPSFLVFFALFLFSSPPVFAQSETQVGSFSRTCISSCGCTYTVTQKTDEGTDAFEEGPNCKLAPAQCDKPCLDDTFTTDDNDININDLLPNPLPPASDKTQVAAEAIQAVLAQHPNNIDVYKQAAQVTGVPWQVLAGIHYREASGNPKGSLVSGRIIGQNEPDIVAGPGCSAQDSGPGKPIPLSGGGCGFKTLLDSAIYAGNHLRGKVAELNSYESLVKALSSYNGGGNSNCDEEEPLIYYTENPSRCPNSLKRFNRKTKKIADFPAPPFYGDDDPYATNFFDEEHTKMFIIFCYDNGKCAPARSEENPGAMAIIRGLL